MFLKAFKKLQDAIKSNDSKKLSDSVDSFKNGFKSNQIGINTLIPVTNDSIPINKYKYNSSETPLIAFVPSLVVIFDNIDDFVTRKILIKSFIENKGNINLKSYTKDITALSDAIRLQDKELTKFLLENGADVKYLKNEQKEQLDNLIKENTDLDNEYNISSIMVKQSNLSYFFWSVGAIVLIIITIGFFLKK